MRICMVPLWFLLIWPASAVADPVEIRLERGADGWGSPAYSVAIRGDGTLIFDTCVAAPCDPSDQTVQNTKVMFPGRHVSRMRAQDVEALLRAFDAAGFVGLADTYRSQTEDLAVNRLTLRRSGRIKSVLDDGGIEAGMPRVIVDLMQMIDDKAATHRWLRGNPGMLADMVARDGTLSSEKALGMASIAQLQFNRDMLRALINLGMPMNSGKGWMFGTDVLDQLYRTAIEYGWEDVFAALEARSPVTAMSPNHLRAAFVQSGGCSLTITRRLLALGVPPDIHDVNGRTIYDAANEQYKRCPIGRDERLQALSALGAD